MESVTPKYQTVLKRVAAGFIDGIIFLPFTLLLVTSFENASIEHLVWLNVVQEIAWAAYSIIGHGKYGWTLGKKLVGIKVLNLEETAPIGYNRAFMRESVWIILSFLGFLDYFFTSLGNNSLLFSDAFTLEDYLSLISLVWTIVEIVSTLTNSKRRAVHDFLATSVVVDVLEKKREDIPLARNAGAGLT